jgi:hypothetical protein
MKELAICFGITVAGRRDNGSEPVPTVLGGGVGTMFYHFIKLAENNNNNRK